MARPTEPDTDTPLTGIARRHFHGLETLETRNRDAQDFHDVAVWAIRHALDNAYAADFAAVTKRTGACT
ncbi:hypothetical protein J7376_16420 [Paracoccus sp. R12_1]|uniref:DUF6900 domain-containing protein n=1 Tax=unclassified Paracoccus (in: a-proteobacteria) TaxID=2688777 RepID=UPI001ADA139A|nr:MULTISPECIES: hypothetical protein [unclassified Paracoccus (in: a-proteobacteria)]MBO9457007.1 hypothetical protein [Paracoccus sp. R12_2]MBO9488108.1 hypothetical protein [Paracoccus sp. R12_1]